jgi:hypothetical protein
MRRPSTLDILLTIALSLIVFGLVGMARAEPIGDLYAFCDTSWPDVCDQQALMLQDVCAETVRTYGDGSDRFSCAVVDAATRDAYLDTLEPDIREKTFQAWREGR